MATTAAASTRNTWRTWDGGGSSHVSGEVPPVGRARRCERRQAMQPVHLDTDIGSDTDDLCALAMLLASTDVRIVGITTCADIGGLRAGFVEHVLRLVGRSDIPVAAGADGSLGGFRVRVGVAELDRYWPQGATP